MCPTLIHLYWYHDSASDNIYFVLHRQFMQLQRLPEDIFTHVIEVKQVAELMLQLGLIMAIRKINLLIMIHAKYKNLIVVMNMKCPCGCPVNICTW